MPGDDTPTLLGVVLVGVLLGDLAVVGILVDGFTRDDVFFVSADFAVAGLEETPLAEVGLDPAVVVLGTRDTPGALVFFAPAAAVMPTRGLVAVPADETAVREVLVAAEVAVRVEDS